MAAGPGEVSVNRADQQSAVGSGGVVDTGPTPSAGAESEALLAAVPADAISDAVARNSATPWHDRRVAIEEVSRARFEFEAPGTPISEKRFAFEASLLGSEVQVHATVYRIDSRPPDVIMREGFMPRSDKPSSSLAAHIESPSGNMVSGTSQEANAVVLWGLAGLNKLPTVGENIVAKANAAMSAQFAADLARFRELVPEVTQYGLGLLPYAVMKPGDIEAAVAGMLSNLEMLSALPDHLKVVAPNLIDGLPKTHEQALETAYNIWARTPGSSFEPLNQTFRVYEYRMSNVAGAAIDGSSIAGFDFSEQHEITIPSARPDQIVAAREVLLHTVWEGYLQHAGYTLERAAVTAEFGEWQDLTT